MDASTRRRRAGAASLLGGLVLALTVLAAPAALALDAPMLTDGGGAVGGSGDVSTQPSADSQEQPGHTGSKTRATPPASTLDGGGEPADPEQAAEQVLAEDSGEAASDEAPRLTWASPTLPGPARRGGRGRGNCPALRRTRATTGRRRRCWRGRPAPSVSRTARHPANRTPPTTRTLRAASRRTAPGSRRAQSPRP